MNPLPTKFYPPFLEEPRTRIPPRLRNWLGYRLQGPPRGTRRRQKRACVFALGRIGDFVLSLSSFRLFAREFGPDQLTLVAPAVVQPLIACELPGVETIALPSDAPGLLRDLLPVWRRLRPQFADTRFDRRITLNTFRTFYQEIAWTWGDATTDFRLPTPENFPQKMPDGQCRELQAHRHIVSAALGRIVGLDEILPSFTAFPSNHDGRLLVYPLSHDGLKNIPVARVVEILRPWRARHRAPLVLGGNPRDAVTLENYAAALRAAGVEGVSVEAPVGILAFIQHLAAASAVLAAESAAGHIANALDKPAVTVIPRALYGHCQPWHRSNRQRGFSFDAPDAEIAAALPAL